jgi:TRAP-type transport system periplasmic protein
LPLSRLTPMEERKSGYFDYIIAAHQKLNVQYLGRVHAGAFYLWVKREPKSLADLKGLKMRTGSLYDRFMQALGMVPVNVNAPETYTALESGLVDGFGWPVIGPRQQGWIKKASYVIDLPFFGASNVVILMNGERWQSLKPEVQKKLADVTAASEPKMLKHFTDVDNAEWAELTKAGVKRVKFSPAENKQYLDTAYAVEWKYLEGKLSPDELAKLRRLSGN